MATSKPRKTSRIQRKKCKKNTFDHLIQRMAAQNQRIKSAISLIVKPPHSHFNTDKYHICDIFTLYFIMDADKATP